MQTLYTNDTVNSMQYNIVLCLMVIIDQQLCEKKQGLSSINKYSKKQAPSMSCILKVD